MSSGQKAVAEDEQEWADFLLEHSLTHKSWDVYSPEAAAAKAGWKNFSFTCSLLEKYVNIEMELAWAGDNYRQKLDLLKKVHYL
mgnify:FL=1